MATKFCLGRTQNKVLVQGCTLKRMPCHITHILLAFPFIQKVDDFSVLKVVGVKYFSK